MTLTIVKAEVTYSGGGPLEEYKLTYVLDNRFSIPVGLEISDSLNVTAVRENGAEVGDGFVSLPDTYEIRPGRTTFATEHNDPVTALRNFGSPITAFKLSGSVGVRTRTWDIENSLYCEYKGLTFGKPLQGYWGS
ncbi:hypothetical protein ASG92_16670 [Arthrobacter sp. Soil736]|nr:hypothetical protein ASG92_16670 [Arthrobacter sp. Soil736]